MKIVQLLLRPIETLVGAQASEFANLSAAADTMRTEAEGAAAKQQRRAETLADAVLRQTNNQQTAHESMQI